METLQTIPKKRKAPHRREFPDKSVLSLNGKNRNLVLRKTDFDDLIEIKKQRRKKYYEQTTMFFYIGLAISLFLISMAFNWKFYDDGSVVNLTVDESSTFDEVQDIPMTEQPPPPPPQAIQLPRIIEVPDEIIVEEVKVNIDVETTEDMVIEEVEFEPLEEEEVEEIFYVVENQPEPVGGYEAFYQYVGNNLEYPRPALRNRIQGRVYIQFIVGKDGSISNANVIKGIDESCDKEALRVIKNAPKWKAGSQRGVPVKVYMTIPIVFKLR